MCPVVGLTLVLVPIPCNTPLVIDIFYAGASTSAVRNLTCRRHPNLFSCHSGPRPGIQNLPHTQTSIFCHLDRSRRRSGEISSLSGFARIVALLSVLPQKVGKETRPGLQLLVECCTQFYNRHENSSCMVCRWHTILSSNNSCRLSGVVEPDNIRARSFRMANWLQKLPYEAVERRFLRTPSLAE